MRRNVKIAEEYGQKGPHKPVATALAYDPRQAGAPRVVASGRGPVAEQILELARKHGVPICDDPILAGVLSQVNLGDEIPEELYQVVAEVLAYIYRIAASGVSGPGRKIT